MASALVGEPSVPPNELIGVLQKIDQRSREKAASLPQQEEIKAQWEGVVFSVANTRVVAPLSEVCEILNFPPEVTDVPGTHAWMVGVANIRGSLLPIVDLQAFLGGRVTTRGRHNRTLVIRLRDKFVGLLVDERVSMRHFLDVNRCPELLLVGSIANYIDFSFEQDGEAWPVFSMRALAASQEFQVAAL
ncbi:MAG: chemotaxis protein CheW [Candidatus Polarisedimenticolaceae bacterium]|nr:chemotaxis protein CheW [Candidatus Polarisedimenticolaceae bacterium]